MFRLHQKTLKLCPRHVHLHRHLSVLYNKDGHFEKFNFSNLKEIEKSWQSKLREEDKRITTRKAGEGSYYVLSMFPYPSGALHMGHVRVYTISDVMARFHRLTGKHVIHPMGWDAFGLPAENAAIERGEIAQVWTRNNISSMRDQMEQLCLSFDWDRGFATCDPDYYKWTQWIFLKMFERDLVTYKMGQVDWDPVDETVLAAEQIDNNGCSWRSGAKVEKRFLKQWYINTTAYTKSLVDGLTEVDSDLWKDVQTLQAQWLGECTGTHVHFTVMDGEERLGETLSVFTEQPHCLYGASHIVLYSAHYLNTQQYHASVDSNVGGTSGYKRLRIHAINPLSGEKIAIIGSRQETPFGKAIDSHLGIPSVSETDNELATVFSLQHRNIVAKDGNLQNSDQLSGLTPKEGFEAAIEQLQEFGCGGNMTSELARDWLISRQRYWGTPIPIIHCPKKGPVPVPYAELPVTLPTVTSMSGRGSSPLTTAHTWRNVKCHGCDCDGQGLRETDTMDTFVDSSWYFLRYLDSGNTEAPFSPEAVRDSIPVDLYIGGKEHATMHLYYARFVSHFLYNEGLLPQREPFLNLLTQGLVKGMSYYVADTNKFLRPNEVSLNEDNITTEKSTGALVEQKWMKMSKSKYNGVDPQEILAEFGCDATRLAILSNTAPKSDRNWNTDVFVGVKSWMGKLWKLVAGYQQCYSDGTTSQVNIELSEETRAIRNYFVNEVNHHMEKTFLLSVAISRLQGLTNALRTLPNDAVLLPEYRRALIDLIIMLAPFAPTYSMILWDGFTRDKCLWEQQWPNVDEDYTLPLKIKVNGKQVFKLSLPQSLAESEMNKSTAIQLAKSHPSFNDHIEGVKVKSLVYSAEPGLRYELNYVTKKRKKDKASPAV